MLFLWNRCFDGEETLIEVKRIVEAFRYRDMHLTMFIFSYIFFLGGKANHVGYDLFCSRFLFRIKSIEKNISINELIKDAVAMYLKNC